MVADYLLLNRGETCDTNVDSRMNPVDEQSGAARPQGTVVIVSVFGALLVLGWLLMFFGLFVPRGTH